MFEGFTDEMVDLGEVAAPRTVRRRRSALASHPWSSQDLGDLASGRTASGERRLHGRLSGHAWLRAVEQADHPG